MAWITGPEMVIAVCEAGGLGTLAAATLEPAELARQIMRVREKTSRPFAVNIPLRLATAAGAVEAVLQGDVPVVVCSAGDPFPWVARFKDAGRIVLQVVFNREMALRAGAAGVDGLIAMGAEAGGNLCPDELTTLVLVPQIVDATDLPVVAAGGIADSRGFAAALALGAHGIQIGTRLLATWECTAHPRYKRAVLEARDVDSTVLGRSTGLQFRVLRNEAVRQMLDLERRGEDRATLDRRILDALRKAVLDGDVDEGAVVAGQAAGLVREELTVAQVLEGLMEGVRRRLDALRCLG
jgi:enoyl-[acyl-carrier protein] reductase II